MRSIFNIMAYLVFVAELLVAVQGKRTVPGQLFPPTSIF